MRAAGIALLAAALGAAPAGVAAQAAPVGPIHAAPLPAGSKRVPASADECAVWKRELAFARTVEAHDGAAFAAFLHSGTVFDAGSAEADRGRDAVRRSWQGIVDGVHLGLRWRPGIVQIGGEPNVAVSRGPYILQVAKAGTMGWQVGFYQSVWHRERAGAPWLILFDASASTPLPVADRAAADAWVMAQPVSACDEG